MGKADSGSDRKGGHVWQTSTTGTVTAGPTERVSPIPSARPVPSAERHVMTVSEACAKDIERSLAGVREFDGMPAGFVAAMKAKVQTAVAPEEQVAEDVENAETAEVEARPRPRRRPSPSRSLPRKSPKLSPRLLRSPLRSCPRSLCLMPPPRRQSSITVAAMRSSATWPCSPLPRLPIRAVDIFRVIWPGGHAVRRFVSVQRPR